MRLTDEMRVWLDARRDDMPENGSAVFINFLEEFRISRDGKSTRAAKMLVRRWDAERRGLPEAPTRKFPDRGQSGNRSTRRGDS